MFEGFYTHTLIARDEVKIAHEAHRRYVIQQAIKNNKKRNIVGR